MKFLSLLLPIVVSLVSAPATAFTVVPLPSSSSPSPSSSAATATRLFSEPTRPTMSFVRGLEEKVVPDVKLTRARDGSSGVATFLFQNPNVFDASTAAVGQVTGLFMRDEEGEISTTSVNARFSNGKPQSIESVYVMKSPQEWDRFMRFMERYGDANGLGFRKA